MKKLLTFSPSKIFIACGLGLFLTLGGFWHYQLNQSQLDRIQVLSQGVTTCFARVTQTFTAMMIKDVRSPYLHQGFMSLSNECLNETINGINPFRKNVGKGYDTLNQLISDTHWFHEKVTKMNAPLVAGVENQITQSNLPERYSQMEGHKLSLIDEIENTSSQIRTVQANDQVLMGVGLLIFVVGVSLLSLQEFNRIQLQREVEREAVNYLKAGQANVGALVDQLVNRALRTQNMPVTAQIFSDYHETLLERLDRGVSAAPSKKTKNKTPVVEEVTMPQEVVETHPKCSLKEALVTLQNIHDRQLLQLNDVRDVELKVEAENLEQILNAAVNKLSASRTNDKKIMVTNQIHADRSVVSFFLGNNTYTEAELAFANQDTITDEIDMNMIILKEMVSLTDAKWHVENKTDRHGNVTGMVMRFVFARTQTQKGKKNLVSVVRGKKSDLREMLN